MKTVSAVIAALLALTTLAPGAFAGEPATTLTTADARVAASAPASVVGMVATDSPLTGRLELLDGVPLAQGGELRAQVTASNPSNLAFDEVVLRLDLTSQRITSRAALSAFLEDPSSVTVEPAAQEPPLPEQEEDDGAVETSDVAGTVAGGTGAGLPGMTADGSTSTDTAADTTSETDGDGIGADNDDPPEPVGVRIAPGTNSTFTLTASADDLRLPTRGWGIYGAILVLETEDGDVPVDSFPLTWGAQEVPQLELAVLAEASGVPSRVQGVLETSDLPGVGVVVDPTHLTTATAIRANLREREVFRLPTRTPDLTSIAHAGNQNLLPLALELTNPDEPSGVTSAPWLAIPAAMDQKSVNLAAQFEAAGILALPSTPGYDQLIATTGAPVARSGGLPVLLPDTSLSETVTQFRPGTPAAAALAVADAALLAENRADEPTLVALDSQWQMGRGAQSTLRALLDAPWVSTVSVASLLESHPPSVSVAEALDVDSNLPVDQVEALGDRLESLTLLSTIATSPEDAMAQWGSDLLRGISVDVRHQTAPRDLAFRRALEDADATLGALRIAESSDLNLLTESGDIPVNLVNGLDHAIRVTVDLRSYSSNLQVLDSPTVTVPAASDQVVLIPVEAVSTANVFVSAVLENADGEHVSDTQPFSIRVRADWGNAATAVFSVVLVLLLVAGLVRTIRRGRKDTRAEPSTPPESMDGAHE